MKRVLLDYLYDILEAINDIETFLKNTDFKKFQSDNMRRNADIEHYQKTIVALKETESIMKILDDVFAI